MTTPEPRVRVRRYDAPNWPYRWQWICDLCLDSHDLYESHSEALAGAAMHRCPAMRFRALVRELEGLRDTWRAVGNAGLEAFGDSEYVRSWHWRAADLTAIIDRAGGTGC